MSKRKTNNLKDSEFSFSDLIRFFSKVNQGASCWRFDCRHDEWGYARFSNKKYRSIPANKVSYAIHYGSTGNNKIICHTCDNAWCVNPEHLYMGTDKSNSKDKIVRGRDRGPTKINREKKFCKNGHKFTKKTTYLRKRKTGGRICKTCNLNRSKYGNPLGAPETRN